MEVFTREWWQHPILQNIEAIFIVFAFIAVAAVIWCRQ